MKTLLITLLVALSITPAYAEGGHGHGWGHEGGRWGHGGGWGGYWIFPALITGAVIYDVTQPRTVYVEPAPVYSQGTVTSVAPQSGAYWYYCPASRTYYPYVSSCPSGWQTVPATPPAPAPVAAMPPAPETPSAPATAQSQK